MDVSNKTLAMFLVATIIISLAGTIMSINKLGTLTATGFATNNQTGIVNISIAESLSIVLYNNSVYFGSCSTAAGGYILESNDSDTGSRCIDENIPRGITVKNDGNINANVSINTSAVASDVAQTFTGNSLIPSGGTDAPSQFFYTVKNTSPQWTGGCLNRSTGLDGSSDNQHPLGAGITKAWINFTAPAVKFRVCENLSYDATGDYDTVTVYFKVRVPSDALTQTNNRTTVSFTAYVP